MKCPIDPAKLEFYKAALDLMLQSESKEEGLIVNKWLPRCENKHIMKSVKKPVVREVRGQKCEGKQINCDICKKSYNPTEGKTWNCESGKCDYDLCSTCVEKL